MGKLLSHTEENKANFSKALELLQSKLKDYPQHEALLNQLTKFPLGRFLIEHKGINGYWTDVVVTHPTQKGQLTEPLTPLEKKVLEEAPTFLATQQRYQIFRQQLQVSLPNAKRLLSVPSGLMSELLSLDYEDHPDIELIAVDLDGEILNSIQDNVEKYQLGADLMERLAILFQSEG